ncbi:MAG: fatty acyl-AMP ligase [Cyanobacteria bacterium P01_C01_bin.72]
MSSQLESNIVEILQRRAITQGSDLAYIFLQDGEIREIRLTYQELDAQAKAIAVTLLKRVNPGSRAILIYSYSAGLEFIAAFFGCLYAGVVAVPCHPPKNRLTTLEVQTRIDSAEAAVILTESSSFGNLNRQLESWGKASLHCLNTDKIELPIGDEYQPPQLNADTLAFLQYTSGSTGEPKGVMISHGCLLHNQEMLKQAFGHTPDLVGVGWLPLFHDMGLIGNVIQPIYLGGYCVLMSPVSFVQKPIRWLQAISKYGATTSGAPNFAYDLLCDRLKAEQIEQLDLSSWEVAFCGAEPIQMQTIEQFSRKFAVCSFKSTAFYPCYGMAEATLMITGGDKDQLPQVIHLDKAALEQNKVLAVQQAGTGTKTFISAGYPWLNGKIAIVDSDANSDHLRECESDRIGEICYSGSSVGQGYWKLKEQTAQTFQSSLRGEYYLRTGDLGFLQDGELYITGRLHDVLVFWGLNHYPQHIEQTVAQAHPGLKPNCGAAFAVEVEGKPRLVIAQEIKRTYRKSLVMSEVVEAIRWQVFQQHFIDIYGIVLLPPGRMPQTSSGKVQRRKCQDLYLTGALEIWQQWHQQDVAQSDITGLFQRYTNPLTYLKILAAIARGRLRRVLYSLSHFSSARFAANKKS